MATVAHQQTRARQDVNVNNDNVHSAPMQEVWEIKPWKPVLAGIALLLAPVFFIIILVGGILFWMPHLPSIAHGKTNYTELQIAENGIGTMKKMVGDNAAWAKAVKEEYQRIYGSGGINNSLTACANKTTTFNAANSN